MSQILIVDDHSIIVHGLVNMLAQSDPAIKVHYADHIESAKTCLTCHPNISLMLLDRTLQGTNGLHYLKEFHAISPALRIAILSGYETRQYIKEAFEAGAAGFIPKSYSIPETLAAINKLLKGNLYIPDELIESPYSNSAKIKGISEHDLEILCFAMNGLTNKEIAKRLGVTENTVKQHFTRIFKVLKAKNRTHAIQIARSSGLIC